MAYIKLFEHPLFCTPACQEAWEKDYEETAESYFSAEGQYEYLLENHDRCLQCQVSNEPHEEGLRFLLAKPGFSLNYLGFGFRVCDDNEKGGVILEGPARHAKWQGDRLASGMAGGRDTYLSHEEAQAGQQVNLDLGVWG